MKKIILENGKEVQINEESYKELQKAIQEDYIEKNASIGNYGFLGYMSKYRQKVKNTIRKNNQIYVNEIFADKSIFGDYCVFIKCKFDSGCEFGSNCKFDKYCKFDSGCEFGSGCEFSSDCKFGSNCKKTKPYWDENGKHE